MSKITHVVVLVIVVLVLAVSGAWALSPNGSNTVSPAPEVNAGEPVTIADFPTPTPELPGPTIAAPAPAEPSVQDTAQCPSGKATLLVVPQTAAVGEIASTDIVLCRPFTGLAGFQLQVIVEGGATAQIVGLKTPDFGLLTHSPVPTSRLRIEAVDLPDLVPVKSERAVLVTIQLRGSSPGVIAIKLSAEAIDDDLGNPINPQIIAGALTVY